MENKEINQTQFLEATPHEVYEMLMDSEKHSKFTGQKCEIRREAGESFTCFDGWVEGKNLVLVPDEKIVQEWRGKDWPEGVISTVTFELIPKYDGTEILLNHTGVPEDKYESVNDGWKEHYWDKMKKYLTEKV